MSIKIDLFDPNLKEKLATLPEKMADWTEEVLLEQAYLIVGLAQVYCPVNTGSLRDSIRVERGGNNQHWREVRVRCGGYVTNPLTKHIVNYALYVEQRTPFFYPAVNEVQPTIKSMIEAKVVEKANE